MSQPDVLSGSALQQHPRKQVDQARQHRIPSQTSTEDGVLSVRPRKAPPPVPPRIQRKPVAQVGTDLVERDSRQSPNSPLPRSPPSTQRTDSFGTTRTDLFAASDSLSPTAVSGHAVNNRQNFPTPSAQQDVDSSSSSPDGGLAPVFIGVVGVTGSGKSTFIHRVTGCKDIIVADGLQSGEFHTQAVASN